jgi:hypothetical protein
MPTRVRDNSIKYKATISPEGGKSLTLCSKVHFDQALKEYWYFVLVEGAMSWTINSGMESLKEIRWGSVSEAKCCRGFAPEPKLKGQRIKYINL